MSRRIAAFAATFALLAGSAVAPAAAPASAVAAKHCSSAYTPAVIGGKQKCLHAGEFCAKRYRSQYPAYGFRCVGGRLR